MGEFSHAYAHALDHDQGEANGAKAPPGSTSIWLSLAFWMSLIIAAALFASVALATRVLTYGELEGRAQALRLRLIEIDDRCQRLEKVVTALRQDPQFLDHWKRAEFETKEPTEEVLSTEMDLNLTEVWAPRNESPLTIVRPWWLSTVAYFAYSSQLRIGLLSASAALILVAFTFFHPASLRQMEQQLERRQGLWQSLRQRYVRKEA